MTLPIALGPLSEGAVTEGDWGSVLSLEVHSLRHGLHRATSLREGGKEDLRYVITSRKRLQKVGIL